ncbi:uncharacterized protein LOC130701108 isoform X2 [Daphnia carinata]|uniref:uncharacterized protein LOC130701108 isoform X2 n=1 Tax=Daphnia carinata TaxID=120202 RepID=UPI00257EF3C7|nr:uncharacterized protein LOC130701108 isoform X2 [Daphnia carinata]
MYIQEKMFVCLLCSHTSKSQLSMRSHVMETHVPEESFYKKSNTCVGKQVPFSENQHVCQICLKSFKEKWHLKNHLRSHAPRMKHTKKHALCRTEQFLHSLQPVRRSSRRAKSALQNDVHEKGTAVCEPLQNTDLQSPISSQDSSFSSVNCWPKVVLSSHLNLLLCHTFRVHAKV